MKPSKQQLQQQLHIVLASVMAYAAAKTGMSAAAIETWTSLGGVVVTMLASYLGADVPGTAGKAGKANGLDTSAGASTH
jgi:hypothetical protein